MVKFELYNIPNERVILSEYDRILSDGMATMIRRFSTSIYSQPKLIFDKFKDEDREDAKYFPIFSALYNQTSSA
jgi:hypothetical protein